MKAVTVKTSKTLVSAMVFSALLSACMVGPDYTKPDPKLASFHNQSVLAPTAPTNIDVDVWWKGFGDPALTGVVQRALEQNLDLAAAVARVDQARAVARAAGANLLPNVALDASVTSAHQSLSGATGTVASGSPAFSRGIHDYAVGPSASWELDLSGGLRRAANAAGAEEQAVEADRTGTRIVVAAEAADAYLQVRGYQARLAVAQQQIADDEHLLTLVNDRYSAGSDTGREVAQATALLKQARASVPALTIGLEQQLNRLDVLMGAQPGTYAAELREMKDVPSVPAIPMSNEPTDLLRRRPDVIAAERRLAASNERIGTAVSEYYPKISLSAAVGFDSLAPRHLLDSRAFQAAGIGALHWRLFDFGRVDAEVAQAKGRNAEELAVYRQSVLKAAQDVEDALVTLIQTQRRLGEIQAQVEELIKARDLSEEAYRAGSITLTDVLNADSQLLTARDEFDADRANAARAAVGVYRALGGGWTPSEVLTIAARRD